MSLAACGQPAEEATPANTASPATPAARVAPVAGPERLVLAFGDSLYAGYGLSRGQSLPDALQDRLRTAGINARFVNAGVSAIPARAAAAARLYARPAGQGARPRARPRPARPRRQRRAAPGAAGRDAREPDGDADELKRLKIPVVLTGMMAPPNLGPDFAGRFNARLHPALAKEYGAPLDPFICKA
ncbi:arylesterase [Sphingomonas sp. MMS24-JH45]